MSRLILLPGWGLGPAALQPLLGALREQDVDAELADLPAPGTGDPEAWLAELDARLPGDVWLGGWSLGGMLATALAARRGIHCRGLLTLASNACFVVRPGWPQAMPWDTTFAAFREGCERDAGSLLKRFALLCSQGCSEARILSRQLGQGIPAEATAQRLAGLEVLAALDNRAALAAFTGPQLHLLAEADALVPSAVVEPLQALLSHGMVECFAGTGHAFVLERPQALAARLAAFIREADDD